MSLSGGALLHAESMLIVPLIRYANEDDWDVSRSGGALVARVGGEEVVVTPRRGQSMDTGMQVLITAPRTLSHRSWLRLEEARWSSLTARGSGMR